MFPLTLTTILVAAGLIWVMPDGEPQTTAGGTGRSITSDVFPDLVDNTVASAFTELRIGGAFPTAGLIPAPVLENYRSALTIPPSFTLPGINWPNTNYSAYCDNQSVGINSCVGYFSAGYASSAQANVYGSNNVISNTKPAFGFSAANNGNHFNTLLGNECNANIWTLPGGVIPNGTVDCFLAIGGGNAMPAGGANAHRVAPFASGVPWTRGFKTDNGAATVGIQLGAAGTAGTVASQGINFVGLQNGAASTATVQYDAGKSLNVGVPTAGKFAVQVNGIEKFSATETGITIGVGQLAFVCGSSPGTAKLVGRAGGAEITLSDNIGSGVAGC